MLDKKLTEVMKKFTDAGYDLICDRSNNSVCVHRDGIHDVKATATFKTNVGYNEFTIANYLEEQSILEQLPADDAGRLECLRYAKERVKELGTSIKETDAILKGMHSELSHEHKTIRIVVKLLEG